MFDVGWSEMAVILMVALIVIGPKDLPRVARTVGKWTAKARGMAREAELQDIKAEMDKLSRTDVRHRLEETIDPDGAMRRGLSAPVESEPVPATPPAATAPEPLPPPPDTAAPSAPQPAAPAVPPEKG